MIQFLLQNFETSGHRTCKYKKSKLSKENYRPICILPNVSRIYERCLYDQIATYFARVLVQFLCGFRKVYSAQHCLLAMIKKWEKM